MVNSQTEVNVNFFIHVVCKIFNQNYIGNNQNTTLPMCISKRRVQKLLNPILPKKYRKNPQQYCTIIYFGILSMVNSIGSIKTRYTFS